MSRSLPVLALAALILVPACATRATMDQLRTRAAFDFECPQGSLELVDLDDRTRGVRGCGQRATYVEQCKPCANGYQGCECTWLMNTDGVKQGGVEAGAGTDLGAPAAP